jgi:hypothetical protein
MIHYLIYVSQAGRPMAQDEVADILGKSRINNRRDCITGLIIYKLSPDGSRAAFMQALEGDRETVLATYKRIAADPRHHTKIVLEEGDAAERSFPDWLMGFRNLAPGDLAASDNFSDLGEPGFWARAKAGDIGRALEVMQQFYEDV